MCFVATPPLLQEGLLDLLKCAPNHAVSKDVASEAVKLEKKALKLAAKEEVAAAKAASKGKPTSKPRTQPS